MIVINIYDFDSVKDPFIQKKILEEGRILYSKNCITSGELSIDGSYTFWLKPEDNHYYGTRTYITVTDDGDVSDTYCSCQYVHNRELCRHQAACLFYIKDNFKNDLEKRRKAVFNHLMNDLEVDDADDETPLEPVKRIIPVITTKDREIQCSLKAGGDKLYAVSSIPDLKAAFESEMPLQYGKKCVMIHRYSDLDEDSRRLLEVCYYIYTSVVLDLAKTRNKAPKKNITVRGKNLDVFFRLFNGREVEIDGMM
ncbi:MAG: hypothetical protein IKH71_05290, partial [Oscillospiraceae bacterium]|nr:hypothetical protein [Oscillospiraceae bacterium]